MTYARQEVESAIEYLAEVYPKAFFIDPTKRVPLKHNITADLINEGVELARDLVR
jgi:sRNA-binding protein